MFRVLYREVQNPVDTCRLGISYIVCVVDVALAYALARQLVNLQAISPKLKLYSFLKD